MSRALGAAAVAWLITALYYFYQYALRSAPAVMMPQLSEAFGLTSMGVASMVGPILAAVESINTRMQATLDAGLLCKMADRKQIRGGILDVRWPSTTRSARKPPRSRASTRPSLVTPTCCSLPTSRPATSWRSWCRTWRRPTAPASCSARGGSVERVDVLPFHQMGRFKWARLGLEYKLHDVPPSSGEAVEQACAAFKAVGLKAY